MNNNGAAILKPALGRGLLRCVGATSADKFKKTIEQDAALERRFQQVPVEEPNVDDAVFAVEPWSEKNIRLTLPLGIGLPLAGIVTPPDSPIASVLPVAIAGLWIFIFIDLLKAAVPEDDFDF